MLNARRQKQLERLVDRLGLTTANIDWQLLDIALTHPTTGKDNYQQLEFLGDSVVRLAASELLLEVYPQLSVGDFSAIRRILVSDRILSELADRYGLEAFLTMAASAAADPLGKTSRLADAFEAVLGALYLATHNLTLVRPWLDRHFCELAEEILRDPARQNYKDALQAWTQGNYNSLPEYRVREIATESSPHFIAEVWFQDKQLGTGEGKSKKAAEQLAAKMAVESVNGG